MNRKFVPCFFTLFNLSLGIISIAISYEEKNFIISCLLILFAAFIDRYDGKIARKLNCVTDLGKELDSLSDLLSFGVAPSIIMWKINFLNYGLIGYIILLLFPLCGAFRLAKFNISDFDNVYTGVPITVAGSIIALDALVTITLGSHDILSVIFVVLLSYLMISKVKIKKI